jgi:IstB-like ATP binding protein
MNKTETKSGVLLKHHLKALKLPTMHAECEKIAQRCAADNADHLAFLLQLCELELIERERKAAERRLKMARFPSHKLLDEFDFQARPSINKPLVLELVKGEYLDKRENILLVGPSGTGKPQPTQYPSRHAGMRRSNHGERSNSPVIRQKSSTRRHGSTAGSRSALPGGGVAWSVWIRACC